MSWENWTSAWRATRGSDDDHWTYSQWGDATKWQSWSTDYTTHVYSDADYLQGWCYADNEHDSDWGSAWIASMPAAIASHVARLDYELEFLKQKLAHYENMDSQSVTFVNDRTSCGGEFNTNDSKNIVCKHTHGHGELISPNLMNDLKMESVWDWTGVFFSFNLASAAELTTAALAMGSARLQCSHRCGKNRNGNRFMQSHLAVVCRECSRGCYFDLYKNDILNAIFNQEVNRKLAEFFRCDTARGTRCTVETRYPGSCLKLIAEVGDHDEDHEEWIANVRRHCYPVRAVYQ